MGTFLELTQRMIQRCYRVWSALQTYWTCSDREIFAERFAERFVDGTTFVKHKMNTERFAERSWWGKGSCTVILLGENGNQLAVILLQRRWPFCHLLVITLPHLPMLKVPIQL